MISSIDSIYAITPVRKIPPRDKSMANQEDSGAGYKPRKPEGKELNNRNLIDFLV